MNLDVLRPWALVLLPLCLAPLLFHGQKMLAYSSLSLVPRDLVSDSLAITLRVAGALAIGVLVLGISGLFRPAHTAKRLGTGAQIVLLLDRSRSMDEPFAGQRFRHALETGQYESKGEIARKLLSKFIASRDKDMFSVVVFSTFPIEILPLTPRQEVIQAAVDAGRFGRGLAETNIAAGLKTALGFFADRPYTGSRLVILLSDGAGELDRPSRREIEELMKRHRVGLYWIYIRSNNSPKILQETDEQIVQGLSPERTLHRYFTEMDAPYRAYSAENPEALQRAIDDVSRLQNLPNWYDEVIPKRDLSMQCYLTALALTTLLILARLVEIRSWGQAG
ncbi:MAG: VWA domain-containing protein [Gammaproteobacteria bacterium]|nr:VWA domain-containing protein [Gammaproteobacteria bacterium]